jgi:CubicO group peptidase (beta-lactamase class C family)/D-alanyl-D-alanine dipeptidase
MCERSPPSAIIQLLRLLRPVTFGALVLTLACADSAPESNRGATDAAYAELVQKLSEFVEHELEDKGIPAISIALVDDQDMVWATGFGMQDPDAGVPATERTVYRVGSVSKLFTDIAIMQLVERGELDLDAPVTTYLPDFTPDNPFETPITLRQLTSHRSGLVREPPVGHYFDPTEPTLAQTVASLSSTRLVYPPTERIKYSNAAIATVGYVLEVTQGVPFSTYVAEHVLGPLGMTASSFTPEPDVVADLATAYMWGKDGREFAAPTFQLGMVPAGSMYAPVGDLARFMSAFFARGQGVNGMVLQSASVDSMLAVQFAEPGVTTGFGVGFSLGELDGHRYAGHGGAIYGFSTELGMLPDERLGVVAVASMDVSNVVVERIAAYALRLMLAQRAGEALPDPVRTEPVPQDVASRAVGRYATGDRTVEIRSRADRLEAFSRVTGNTYRLRAPSAESSALPRFELVGDDRRSFGTRFVFSPEGLTVGADLYTRVPEASAPTQVPDRWRGLIGEYGWDHNTLFILERDGQLRALIEWLFEYPLTELSRNEFAFPYGGGLYHGERIVFEREGNGSATRAVAAGVGFDRRSVGSAGGEIFTIEPVRPVEELRVEALAAVPPVQSAGLLEPDLVELRDLDSTIRYDIRYATTNNFMQAVFYDEPRAAMQRPAARALVRAHRALAASGFGLLIHDAYRPWHVTKMFWDATPESQKLFVADPANGSRHNRGAAVDLTLFDLGTGRTVEMVGGYDEFSERSFSDYPGGTSLQHWHRELLRTAMESVGFDVYEWEWWHFDYQDWDRYPVLNLRFDEVR